MYSNKFVLKKIEEFRHHNSIYNGAEGKVCYLAYLKVGERGWILIEKNDYEYPHRLHTSVIQNVRYTCDNRVIVTTQNTQFTFEVV